MTKEYNFTLTFKLPPNAGSTDVLVDELYGKGCDDALIGTGIAGQIALEFSRQAETAEAAITTALQDVFRIVPGAQLIEAAPDYVGLTDVAELVAVSRQQMRKLYEQNTDFPMPLHAGKSTLWSLVTVLDWLQINKNYEFDGLVHEVARITARLNTENRMQRAASQQANHYRNATTVKSYSVSINSFFSGSFSTTPAAEIA